MKRSIYPDALSPSRLPVASPVRARPASGRVAMFDETLLAPPPTARPSELPSQDARRKSVLVVSEDLVAIGRLTDARLDDSWGWDMEHAIGASAGLAELRDVPYDVVIADADMTPTSGASLLEIVRAEYPATARVLVDSRRLVGAPRESPTRPYDLLVERLDDAAVIRRTCVRLATLSLAIRHWATQAVVAEFGRGRGTPTVYLELVQAMKNPAVGVRECGRIVETRPDFVERIIRFVNTTSFGHGPPQKISSIMQALMYVGMELLSGLVLMCHVYDSARGAGIDGLSFERMQRHASITARFARRLATDQASATSTFTAALLHDVGKVVLAETMPERYRALLREARSNQRPLHEVERERFGFGHAEVGACLLHQWSVPIDVVEAVAFHHAPSAITEGDRTVLGAVHVADALVDSGRTPYERAVEPYIDRAFLRSIGWLGELPRFRALAAQELEGTAR